MARVAARRHVRHAIFQPQGCRGCAVPLLARACTAAAVPSLLQPLPPPPPYLTACSSASRLPITTLGTLFLKPSIRQACAKQAGRRRAARRVLGAATARTSPGAAHPAYAAAARQVGAAAGGSGRSSPLCPFPTLATAPQPTTTASPHSASMNSSMHSVPFAAVPGRAPRLFATMLPHALPAMRLAAGSLTRASSAASASSALSSAAALPSAHALGSSAAASGRRG